jgi:uncharacterized phage protein gp47/JayE
VIRVSSLLKTLTRGEVLATMVRLLKQLGFETTGWQVGTVQHSLLMAFSTVLSDHSEMGRAIAASMFSSLARGPMLTILSRERYDNSRKRAIKTAGPMTLTSTATVPYTLTPGQLLVSDPYDVQFRNTTGGTIPAGGTLVLQFEARKAGSTGNVARETVKHMLTPVAGVSITNNVAPGTEWYTTTGVDEETDKNLRLRNATKWARLSLEMTADAYINVALGCGGVEKVAVHDSHPRGPGTVDVYVSSSDHLLSATELAAVQAKFSQVQLYTDAAWPRPATDTSKVAVKSPTTQLFSPAGIVYYSGDLDTFRAALQRKLDAFIKAIPLGGYDISPGPAHTVMLSDLYAAIKAVPGCMGASLTSPVGNTTVAPFTLAVPPADWFAGLILTAVTSD